MITGNIQDTVKPELVIRLDKESLFDLNYSASGRYLSDTQRLSFTSTGKTEERVHTENNHVIRYLKDGQVASESPFRDDWIILIILVSAILFSSVRSSLPKLMPDITRFFFLRGINDPASRDISSLFHRHSTLINLISFISLALFAYCAAVWYDFIPEAINGFLFWLISFGIIIILVTLRHMVCAVTGNISEESEAFNEYMIAIYNSYRFSAFFLLILVILLVYTVIFPPEVYFIAGVIVLIIMYLLRISRLFLIFIKHDISIFYLILYLCGLEILPVLISLKYFTGVV